MYRTVVYTWIFGAVTQVKLQRWDKILCKATKCILWVTAGNFSEEERVPRQVKEGEGK